MSNFASGLQRKLVNTVKGAVPKKLLVQRYYREQSGGRKIDLRNPERFTDKMGWYKLYYRDELMRTCSDKASVREYVESCGLGYLLNECYGVYDRAKDIDWDALPKQFVLKNTLAGSSHGIQLVFDKDTLDRKKTEAYFQRSIEKRSNWVTRTANWVYEDRKARIIAEKLLIADSSGDLPDFKFFCFNGRVFCSYLMRNYTLDKHKGENAFLDRDFKLLPVSRTDYLRITEQPEKPKNYEKMVEIAETLSKPFPHVRVDLYNIDGTIIFGELTFFTNSGYIPFDPDSFDFEMGKEFVLPKRNH